MITLPTAVFSLNLVDFAESSGFVTAAANVEAAIAPRHAHPIPLRFSPDNPLHRLLAIERPMSRSQNVRSVYEIAAAITESARFRAALKADTAPQDALRAVYQAMERQGVVWGDLKDGRRHLVTDHMAAKRYDCWSSSLLVLAVGHEMGWPLRLVRAPGHVFVRWQGRGERFNMDFGISRHDADYMREHRITHTSREDGVYLESLSRNAVLGMMLMCRGNARAERGDCLGALYDYGRCLALDPQNAEAHFNRGTTKFLIGDFRGAVDDLQNASEKDRHFTAAVMNLANARMELGEDEKAAPLYEKARSLLEAEAFSKTGRERVEKTAEAFFASGMARWARGDARGAIDEFTKALRRNRALAPAYHQRGLARAAIGDAKGSREDLRRAATFPESGR